MAGMAPKPLKEPSNRLAPRFVVVERSARNIILGLMIFYCVSQKNI